MVPHSRMLYTASVALWRGTEEGSMLLEVAPRWRMEIEQEKTKKDQTAERCRACRRKDDDHMSERCNR